MDNVNNFDAPLPVRRARSVTKAQGFGEENNVFINTGESILDRETNRFSYKTQFDHFHTTITLNEKELISNPLFDEVHIGLSLHSREGHFRMANRFLCQLLGYSPRELCTKNIVEIVNKKDREGILSKLLIQPDSGAGKNIKMVTHALHKNNSKISVIINRSPIVCKQENGYYYLLQWLPTSVHGVSIRDCQDDREELLKEIHHRVKNNLQVISSLLNLQSRLLEDPRDVDLLKTSQDRIHSMALVHEILYDSRNFKRIEMEDYVRCLFQSLKRTYCHVVKDIEIEIHVKEISLPIDIAIPCGLILNELLSNAIKHAFIDAAATKRKIIVSLIEMGENQIELKVRDNGIGMPKNFRSKEKESLGLSLVSFLARDQLQGSFNLLKRKPGTEASIQFQMKMVNP